MTSGEVARTLENLSRQLENLRQSLQPVITRDAADAERFRAIERAIAELQSWQTWATRLILGAVVLGLLSLAYTL